MTGGELTRKPFHSRGTARFSRKEFLTANLLRSATQKVDASIFPPSRERQRERERESSIRRNTRGNFDTPLQIYTGLYLSGAIEKVQTVGIDEFRFQRMLIPSILPGKMKMVRPRSDPRLRIDRIGRTCQVRRSGSVPRDDEISRSARLCTFYTKLFVIPSAARSLIRPSREEYPPRGAEERARV
jgi:hypothetical protein